MYIIRSLSIFPLCCSLHISLLSPALYSVYYLQYSHINIPKEVKLSHSLHQWVNSVFTCWMSTSWDKQLAKVLLGSPAHPAVSNIRLLLTDDREASRLREPGRICDCCHSIRRGDRKKVTEQVPDPSMWCWRNEPMRKGRSLSTGPQGRPGPGIPEKKQKTKTRTRRRHSITTNNWI